MKKYLLREITKNSIKNESDIFVGCTKDSDYETALTKASFDAREEAISYLRENVFFKNSIVSTNFLFDGYDVQEYFVEYAEVNEYGYPCEPGMIIAYSDMPDKTNWLHLEVIE